MSLTMPHSPGLPYAEKNCDSWEENPDYIEACRTTQRICDPGAYFKSGPKVEINTDSWSALHPAGASATDITSFQVG